MKYCKKGRRKFFFSNFLISADWFTILAKMNNECQPSLCNSGPVRSRRENFIINRLINRLPINDIKSLFLRIKLYSFKFLNNT